MGDFRSAIEEYDVTLEKCKTPQEKAWVYQGLEDYSFLRRQVNKAVEYIERRLAEQEKYDTQLDILLTRIYSIERYILAGRVNTAFQIVREMEKTIGPPNEQMIPETYLRIYLELENASEIEKYVKIVDADIYTSKQEAYRASTFWARGKLLK